MLDDIDGVMHRLERAAEIDVAELQYQAGVLVIRFFGSHAEYDLVDAETV